MSHESKPYCQTHVPKVGNRGAAPARGGGAPRGGAPRGGAGGGYKGPNTVSVGGGGNKCPGCGKTVYSNEQLKACAGVWHKGCLKCTSCSMTLNLKTLCSHANKPYCKTHLPRVGHTQVASVAMQSAMKAPKAARMQKGVNRTQRGTFAPGALKPTSGAEIVNPGGQASSDIQSRHAPAQSFVAPEPTPHMEYDNTYAPPAQTYDQGGYDQGGYDQGGYDQGSYDQGGYEEGGYDQGGYDEGGYEAYDEGGYEEGGYEAYDEGGYEEGGYEEGYDEGYYE